LLTLRIIEQQPHISKPNNNNSKRINKQNNNNSIATITSNSNSNYSNNNLQQQKMQANSLENICLEDIFDDDKLCPSFVEFVHKIHSQDAIEFWIEAQMYKKIICGEECAKTARRIYSTYIKKGSQFELTMSMEIKENIRRRIEEGAQVYDQTLFDEAQIAIYNLLTFDCLRTFLAANPRKESTILNPLRELFVHDEHAFTAPRLTLSKHLIAFREERRREKQQSRRRLSLDIFSKTIVVCCF